MTDIHAHFAEEGYLFPEEWERICRSGVRRVVLAADTLPHARAHREFSSVHEGAYFTVGVHPTEGKEAPREEFFDLAGHEKCVAVGEIGLDYHYPETDKPSQYALFHTQIGYAAELGLPIQIHSRDACADTLAILREREGDLKHGFLMHCYSYGKENLEAFLRLGAYVSFGGVVCFKNARRAVESVQACPLSRLLTETDSPYLSPYRGEKNSPANIPVILEKIASLKGVEREEAEEAVEQNAETLFPKLK